MPKLYLCGFGINGLVETYIAHAFIDLKMYLILEAVLSII